MVDSARIKVIQALDEAMRVLQQELPYFTEKEFIEKSTPRKLFPFLV